MSLQALKKDLMQQYPPMKCKNNQEFKQRLQWLSEGMLHNHLHDITQYVINEHEINLYKEFCKIRNYCINKQQ